MLLTLVDLLIVALATNQVIEIWRHSELFRERRFQIQIMKEGFESQSSLSWFDRPFYWWCRLMLCNWCLSVWVGLLVAIAYLSAIAGSSIAAMIIRAAALTFAISRLANLINDVLYPWCRTPKYDALPTETNAPIGETDEQDRGTTGLFPETNQLRYYQFNEPQEICPFCKSDDISNDGEPDYFKNLACTCHACGKKWIEPDSTPNNFVADPGHPIVGEQMSITAQDDEMNIQWNKDGQAGTVTIASSAVPDPANSVNIYTNKPNEETKKDEPRHGERLQDFTG